LRRLVEKTEVIRQQLGSASPVIETRISELLAGGIERGRADAVAAEIERIDQSDKERCARDDLEPAREADTKLTQRLEQLRSQLQRSRRRVGVDQMQLQRVVTYGLKLAGAPPLHASAPDGGPQRFEFRPEEIATIKDEGLTASSPPCANRPIGWVPGHCVRSLSIHRLTLTPKPCNCTLSTRWSQG
jgi:uncharacterized protein YoaH (UPF0181 family)